MNVLAKLGIAMLLGVPAAAGAVTWHLSGVFSDGTTLTGSFAINVYGFLSTAKLTTQANGVFTGATYGPGDSFADFLNGFSISQNAYQDELNLLFASDITTATSSVTLLNGSYECRGSGYCYLGTGGNIRTLVSGVATVPEAATWALMIGGFGLTGLTLRQRRPAVSAVARTSGR